MYFGILVLYDVTVIEDDDNPNLQTHYFNLWLWNL